MMTNTVRLHGMTLAHIDSAGLLDHIFESLLEQRGGWIITANLDFVRRYAHDSIHRTLYDQADIRVADGMPLVWASMMKGKALPERIAGSSLVWELTGRAAAEGRSLYLLGGDPGMASIAAAKLKRRWPALEVVGHASPTVSVPPSTDELESIRDQLREVRPDILLVAFGSPKQEMLIRELRAVLPNTWMIGVGVTFSFIAGTLRRAPRWMQIAGVEWLHRLVQEPRRLAARYLVHDFPFAFRLFARALFERFSG